MIIYLVISDISGDDIADNTRYLGYNLVISSW